MHHNPQDRQNPSAPPTTAEPVSNDVSLKPVALRRASSERVANAGGYLISADAAAGMLCDYFLANAQRGDNAANDELVAELTRRMRTSQACSVGPSFPGQPR